jgi:predicted kinase
MNGARCRLIVFGGLPGTGKSTLARALTQEGNATYLRIDEIEQALRESGSLSGGVGAAGYMAAYAVAHSNLRLGRAVIADCVNPLAITRQAWRRVASNSGARIFEVEVTCSDPAEHRRRVESRSTDIAGLKLPSWDDILRREYEPWDRPRVVIDTAGRSVADALTELRSGLEAAA